MSLIVCPECNNQVSSFAEKCPNCGYPIDKMNLTTDNNIIPDFDIEQIAEEKRIFDENNSDTIKKKKLNKKIIVIISITVLALISISIVVVFFNKLTPNELLQVQNVYNDINSIDTITLSSEDDIEKAEEKYNNLSNKCKRHVKNRKELFSARKSFDKLKADRVVNSINNLGEITIESKNRIVQIRKNYNALNKEQQKQVSNYKKLEKAEELVYQEEIDNCISKINKIGKVSLESYSLLSLVNSAYQELTNEQKELITNYSVLQSANQDYSRISIDNCINLINQIGKVSLENENKIKSAEESYDNLFEEDKKQVNNYSTLKDARAKYNKLRENLRKDERKKELRNVIRISKIFCGSPNSAGGVDVHIKYTNKSQKTIKYANFTVVPYNDVGDIVKSEIGNKSTAHLQDTGPYSPGESIVNGRYWGCIWYNYTISSIKLTEVEIEYTDGTKTTITGNEIDYIIY